MACCCDATFHCRAVGPAEEADGAFSVEGDAPAPEGEGLLLVEAADALGLSWKRA